MVERLQRVDFVAESYSCRFFGIGEEAVVLLSVNEVLLEFEEVGGEEDVGAEGGEEGVEFGGRGRSEGREGT